MVDRTEFLMSATSDFTAELGDYIYVEWLGGKWILSVFPPAVGNTELSINFDDGSGKVAFSVTDGTDVVKLIHPTLYTGDPYISPIGQIHSALGVSAPETLTEDNRRYKIEFITPDGPQTFWAFFNVTVVNDRTLELATTDVASQEWTIGDYIYIKWDDTALKWYLDDLGIVFNRFLHVGVSNGRKPFIRAVGIQADIYIVEHTNTYTGIIQPGTSSILFHEFDGESVLQTDSSKRYKLEFTLPTVGNDNDFWSFFTITEDVPVCYHGDSWVEVRKKVKDVVPGDLVRSADGWVEVKDNIKSWGGNEYLVIDPGRWGCQDPLYMIRGHPVLIDGVERNVEDLENIRIASKDPKECVYCIATDERIFIRVNGMLVCTWKYEEWKNTDLAKRICWESSKK